MEKYGIGGLPKEFIIRLGFQRSPVKVQEIGRGPQPHGTEHPFENVISMTETLTPHCLPTAARSGVIASNSQVQHYLILPVASHSSGDIRILKTDLFV